MEKERIRIKDAHHSEIEKLKRDLEFEKKRTIDLMKHEVNLMFA